MHMQKFALYQQHLRTYLSIALQLVHINETYVTAELTKYMKPIIQEVNKLLLKTV